MFVSGLVTLVYFFLTNVDVFLNIPLINTAFRTYSGNIDQLSYLAFSTNAWNGAASNVEPFTETGRVFYTSGYYVFLGHVARSIGASPAFTWWLVGTLIQCCLVFFTAQLILRFTKTKVLVIFALFPLLAGTFAFYFQHDWLWRLESHAVLWGPFALMFPNNATSVGLVIIALVGLSTWGFYQQQRSFKQKTIYYSCVSLLIGALANFHTYVFIEATFFFLFVAAFGGIAKSKNKRWYIFATTALIVVVILLGPHLSSAYNPLVTFAFGLLISVPGLIALGIRAKWWTFVAFAAYFVGALPNLWVNFVGILNKEEFLLYRSLSSAEKDLSVQFIPGLIASSILIIPLCLVFLVGYKTKNMASAYPVAGMFLAFLMLSTNNLWGANQEPYRFWIDTFFVVTAIVVPISIIETFRYLRANPSPMKFEAVSILAIVVCFLSLADFTDFALNISNRPDTYKKIYVPFDTPRTRALMELRNLAADEIVVLDRCIDPYIYKNSTGGRVAYMNEGMAWPDYAAEIKKINIDMRSGLLNIAEMRNADLELIISDSSCKSSWNTETNSKVLLELGSSTHPDGQFTLFRLQ